MYFVKCNGETYEFDNENDAEDFADDLSEDTRSTITVYKDKDMIAVYYGVL